MPIRSPGFDLLADLSLSNNLVEDNNETPQETQETEITNPYHRGDILALWRLFEPLRLS
jgi:hypothetical protein